MKGGINQVVVKLDPPNDKVKLKSGMMLWVDTTFEPEKHTVVTGTVIGLPVALKFGGTGLPWETEMELKEGDHVVMYYLAVMNCLSREQKKYIRDKDDLTIFIKYQHIYACVREGVIIPINGYLLVEPMEDPEWQRMTAEYKKIGLDLPDLRGARKREVTYGKIAYVGNPIKSIDWGTSEDTVEVKPGDRVIMKRVRDIPVEYEYHAKLDGGKKFYRVRRNDILAIL